MTRCGPERSRWHSVLPVLVYLFPIAAVCQEPVQTRQQESWLSSILLFAYLALAAAVTAVAVRLVRRWH